MVHTLEVSCPYTSKNAGNNITDASTILLLGEQAHISRGWSHIVKPEKAQDFVGLSQTLSQYNISKNNHQADPLCQNHETFQTILVKKLHVWNNNHSNGIETDIPAVPVHQWQSLEVILRVHSKDTVVPTVQNIEAHFKEVTPMKIRALDKGHANINVVFRHGEMEASYFITLNPATDFDKWLRITVPTEALSFSRKIDYAHHPLTIEEVATQTYQTLALKAETNSLQTVQHLTDGKEPKHKLFKEIDLSLYRVSLYTK